MAVPHRPWPHRDTHTRVVGQLEAPHCSLHSFHDAVDICIMNNSNISQKNLDSLKMISLDFDDLTDRLIFFKEEKSLHFGGYSVIHRATHRSRKDKIFAVKVFRDLRKSDHEEGDTASQALTLDRVRQY